MGRHISKVIMVDKRLRSADVEDYLAGHNFALLKDGVEVAQMMRGRRRMGEVNDSPYFKMLKASWMIKCHKLKVALTFKMAAIYQQKGSCFQQMNTE